jgi:Domain of unknown function (DUF5666)
MTQGTKDTPEGIAASRDSNRYPVTNSPVSDDGATSNSEAFDVLFGGEREEWPEQATKKGFRASWPIAVLVALLLIVAGVGVGSYLQRQQGSTSTSATARPGGAAFAGFGGAAAGGTGAAATTPSDVTSGTVTDIIGNTVYVTNASGALVKVTVSSTTTVDRNATSTAAGLRPGDTVTIQGTTAKNGTVAAASISATAKGVPTTGAVGAGFAGRFGGAGGTGAAATG